LIAELFEGSIELAGIVGKGDANAGTYHDSIGCDRRSGMQVAEPHIIRVVVTLIWTGLPMVTWK
jgi:hypothetical protein